MPNAAKMFEESLLKGLQLATPSKSIEKHPRPLVSTVSLRRKHFSRSHAVA